jgi:tRNA uridine 5-carboxymethylaminomethyl modification enzyme
VKHDKSFDVLVCGGGHAGIESALIASKLGCSVLLVTLDTKAIGRMSCNPAIGGLAKGQIVREVDVLLGKTTPEDIINNIFNNLCVGK